MFNSGRIRAEYGISGLIMPYFWLILCVYINYVWIGFAFKSPTFADYIILIIHIILTLIAIIFSHQVLFWAADNKANGIVPNFFAMIIRKMTDSPIELLSSIVQPLENKETTASVKTMKIILNTLSVLILVAFGYLIFIIVAVVYGISHYIDHRNRNVPKIEEK